MNGEVLIVDEHTGRILAGRRYNEGMHQAIEAKEGVEIKNENQTLATITLQNYFRLYDKLSGMTGTAMTEAAEFHPIYKLGVVADPDEPADDPRGPARPRLQDRGGQVRRGRRGHRRAARDGPAGAGRHHLASRSASTSPSSCAARASSTRCSTPSSTSARRAIVAQAGRKGAVTVATNMAGRGTDIMLGGNPEFLAVATLKQRGLDPVETPEEYEAAWADALAKAEEAVSRPSTRRSPSLGGLYVLGTERHESRRIDNQLRGRSGRQGDPGESRFYLSLQDDLMRLFNAAMVERFLTTANIPDDVPIESKMVTRAIQSAQTQVEAATSRSARTSSSTTTSSTASARSSTTSAAGCSRARTCTSRSATSSTTSSSGYVAAETAEGFAEDWDLDQLWTALKTLYPVSVTVEEVEEAAGGRAGAHAPSSCASSCSPTPSSPTTRREEQLGAEVMRELERRVVLSVLDRKWREHLYEMDYLQEGIGLRAMAQRDPLVEYQREGFLLFQAMMEAIKEESVGYLFNLEVQVEQPAPAAVRR